jgi:NAD dependent epimerase/dehydratase family enzyme
VAPNPVTNAQLSRSVARTLHRPALLPVPAFAIRAALGGLADELLGSRRVVPERALALGFRFAVERVEEVLARQLGAA